MSFLSLVKDLEMNIFIILLSEPKISYTKKIPFIFRNAMWGLLYSLGSFPDRNDSILNVFNFGTVRLLNLNLERVEGIEPSALAWKAKVLPLNYTRALVSIYHNINKFCYKKLIYFIYNFLIELFLLLILSIVLLKVLLENLLIQQLLLQFVIVTMVLLLLL